VGYFDEGVYGNFGWGDRETSAPMGASGLVRFSPDLQPDWHYPSHVDTWGAISDCYALNVDDETVWTCYYTGFPIVRVRGDVVTGWRNDFSSVRALAASDSRVALCGSGPGHDHLVVGSLSHGRLHTSGEYRLVLPDGQALPSTTRVIGRGPELHLLTDDNWYRASLQDIPTIC
jgi:hypothetical protein